MKKFSFMSLVVIAGMIIPASASFAETRIESVVGTVTKVDILTQSYIRKTPKDERICAIEEVPVYGEGKQGDEIGSMIIGGLIGSAVGNKLSSADGGGAAGAVAGALLGANIPKTAPSKVILSAIASRRSVKPSVSCWKRKSQKPLDTAYKLKQMAAF